MASLGLGRYRGQYGRRWDGDDGNSPMPKNPTGTSSLQARFLPG